MCKSTRNKELTIVLRRQLHTNPFRIGRRTATNVHGNIEDRTTRNAQQLCLCHGIQLIVQTAQCPLLRRKGMVVLHKVNENTRVLHLLFRPALHEPATCVTKHLRLEDADTHKCRFNYVHIRAPYTSLISRFK